VTADNRDFMTFPQNTLAAGPIMRIELDNDGERTPIMNSTLDTAELKQLLKDTLIELLAEHREDFQEFLIETLEDMAMIRAIQEGENTPLVDKADIFRLLDVAP
jgi:hypothetical protein